MRQFLLSCLLFPFFGLSQHYALIDKKLKLPILYTDSVTVEQISSGWFPIENKHIDTLVADLYYLKDMLDVRQRSKMKSFELRASNSVIHTDRVPFAYGDRYNARMSAQCGEVTASMLLTTPGESNKTNLKSIMRLLSYLKSNRSFWKEAYNVTPKVYNVVVITE
jgi:hypothetical protein